MPQIVHGKRLLEDAGDTVAQRRHRGIHHRQIAQSQQDEHDSHKSMIGRIAGDILWQFAQPGKGRAHAAIEDVALDRLRGQPRQTQELRIARQRMGAHEYGNGEALHARGEPWAVRWADGQGPGRRATRRLRRALPDRLRARQERIALPVRATR